MVIKKESNGTFTVYKCIATHNPSAPENAPDSINGGNYWQMFTNMPPIYTPMIMAPYAILEFTQTNELVVKKANGTVTAGMTGAGNIRFWAGGTLPSNAATKIYEDGTIEGPNFQFNPDGSGHVAGMNIS